MVNQEIPLTPEELLRLAEKIVGMHSAKGVNSPLQGGLIADLNYRFRHALTKHEEAVKYKKLMEDSLNERDYIMGIKNSSGIPILIQEVYHALKNQSISPADWGFRLSE